MDTTHKREEEEKGMMKRRYILYITTSFFIAGTAWGLQRSCEEAYDDTSSVYKRTCHPLCLSASCQTQLSNCGTEECKAQYLCWELGYKSGSCNSNEKYLTCPFSDSWKACSLSSCGGYGLRILKSGTKYYLSNNDELSQADFTQEISTGNLASATVVNGKLHVTTSFGTLEACDKNHDSLVGTVAEQVLKKMWRYTECSETSMFENGECIEACNQTTCQNESGNIMCYPYSSLSEMSIRKGEIGECQDNLGTHYGYTKCNEGFEKNASGDCVLATCSLTEYLYSAGNKPDETRGDVMTCYIGGGKRYGYKNCKEGYLFVKNDGATYGMCNKNIDIEAASKSGENKVQLGDYLTKDGNKVAVVYDVTNADGKIRALSVSRESSQPWSIGSGVTIDMNTSSCIIPWSSDPETQDLYGKMKTSGSSVLTTDPSYTGYSKCLTGSTDAMGNYWVTYDYNGRYNTQQIVAFNAKKNTSSGANAGRNYPYCAAVFVNSYPNDPNVFATADYIWNGTVNCNAEGKDINGNACTPPSWSSATGKVAVCGSVNTARALYKCTSGRCAPGQWYLPAEGELGYIYDNRQALHVSLTKGVGNNYGLSLTSYYWSSTERLSYSAWVLYFSSGSRDGYMRSGSRYVRPVLAF